MKRVALAVVVVVIAAVVAVLPVPAVAVARWYSTLAYPAVQRVLTPLSNLVPFALFDVLCVTALCAFALMTYRSLTRLGWRRGGVRLAFVAIVGAAATYLMFLAAWGLNYRRVP